MWPYLPTLSRLALALAIGLFVGTERERRRKEAGLRTFAFVALLGAVGALLGERFAILALSLVGVLVVLLNVETIRTGEGAEITTSAALLLTGFIGALAGAGHTFIPTALGLATAALLAWKEPLAGFSQALTDGELRSAILLAILAFVVYPVLPVGSVDPWHLVEPRAAWVTVILIAAVGFASYVLLKLYGARGIELTGFLGGLVNSTVTVTELAQRVRASGGAFSEAAYCGVMLATAAMLVRNAVLLALLAPSTLLAAAVPLALMFVGASGAARFRYARTHDAIAAAPAGLSADRPGGNPVPAMASPFLLTAALKYGAIFLALQIAGTLAHRALGHPGFYVVCVVGGMVSSASAVASAATLAASGTISPSVAAIGAIIASLTSALIDLPIVARIARDAPLTRRLAWALGLVVLLGAAGAAVQALLPSPPPMLPAAVSSR